MILFVTAGSLREEPSASSEAVFGRFKKKMLPSYDLSCAAARFTRGDEGGRLVVAERG